MNIAFTTILLFIILAPGFIARSTYNSSKLSVNDTNKNIVNELIWSIIPSLVLHIIFIAILHNTSSYFVDFQQLGNLILGVTTSNKVEESFKQLGDFKYAIFLYNLILFSISFTIGYGFRKLIRNLKIDRKRRYFRFTNKWHYIFSGECLDFEDVPDKYEEITDKIINILCKVNGKSILYTGEFFNYYIDGKGDLEAVHLRNPIRRELDKDGGKDEDYYIISSRYLVIPNTDIININFRYFSLEEVENLTDEEKRKAITLDEITLKK